VGANHLLRRAVILTAHQPGYLPWLGLFDKIAQADTYVSFDCVQYAPKEFQNRNRILTPHGPTWLTVPVLRKGYRDKPLNQIGINNRLPWRRRHWTTISHSYGKAPYFESYAPTLRRFYIQDWETLAALNDAMLQWLLAELGIDVAFHRASDHHFAGTKSELVLDMCRKLGATTYIFGSLGRDYADIKAFEAAGIEVRFQDYQHPEYPQQYAGFEPNLSVLDLLMNCGPDSLDILRNR
jgi:hypothetical protein